MGFGNPFSGLERQIKDGFNRMAGDIHGGLQGFFNQLKGQLEQVFNHLANGLRTLANQLESGLKDTANKAEDALKSARHEAENAVTTVKTQGETALRSVAHELEDGLKKAGHTIEDGFEEKIPELFKEVMNQVLSDLQKGALTKAIKIIKLASPDEFGVTIGPMRIGVEDLGDKIDTLQGWADNPPVGKDKIKEMVLTLSPSTLSLDFSAALALVVVTSDSLELGIDLTWKAESIVENLEAICGEF